MLFRSGAARKSAERTSFPFFSRNELADVSSLQSLRLRASRLRPQVPRAQVIDSPSLSPLAVDSHHLPVWRDSSLRPPPLSSNLLSLARPDLRSSVHQDSQLRARVVRPSRCLERAGVDLCSQSQALPSWRLWLVRRDDSDRVSLRNDKGSSFLPSVLAILTSMSSQPAAAATAPRTEVSSTNWFASESVAR